MKSIKDTNVGEKIVLLRVDLNSDVVDKRVLMSERIKESAESIKLLKKRKAKVVVISHQGRPGEKDFTSLRQHAKFLNKLTKVKFVPDILGKNAEGEIRSLKSGDAILLENLRMEGDELAPEKKDNKLRKLAGWCDIYVNDAFSVCHRKQFSITGFPRIMKSFAGPLLEREIKALEEIKIKNCLYILGGAKPEDNIGLLGKNKVLACGLFGQMCVIARGKNLGAQNEYLKKNITNYDAVIKELKRKLNERVETPVDFAVKKDRKRKELSIEEFPSRYEIFDIGKGTQKRYINQIKKARSIYMKGPAGFCADKKFRKGTVELLKAIAANRGFSVIGGGHLSDAIAKSGIPKSRFDHISLSGGALLNYLAGKKLPGLEALK